MNILDMLPPWDVTTVFIFSLKGEIHTQKKNWKIWAEYVNLSFIHLQQRTIN